MKMKDIYNIEKYYAHDIFMKIQLHFLYIFTGTLHYPFRKRQCFLYFFFHKKKKYSIHQ